MFDKGDCSVTAWEDDPVVPQGPMIPVKCAVSILGGQFTLDCRRCRWPDPSWLRAGPETTGNPFRLLWSCGRKRLEGKTSWEVKGSRVGRMPELCLALKEGWRQNFLSFALLQQWRYISVCGVSCSIEKSEMLLPSTSAGNLSKENRGGFYSSHSE